MTHLVSIEFRFMHNLSASQPRNLSQVETTQTLTILTQLEMRRFNRISSCLSRASGTLELSRQ